MVEARWNGTVIARGGDTAIVAGNPYFPPKAVNQSLLRPSDTIAFWNDMRIG